MSGAGPRDKLITFQRDTGTGKDGFGGKNENWTTYCTEWASVRFGSAQERREAAQETATQAATFRVLAHTLTLALTPKDRISGYLGANWDIISVSPFSDEIEVTAIRKAA